MHIAVISPILAPTQTDHRTRFRSRDCAGIPAEFTFAYIEAGPAFIVGAYDDTYAAPGLLKKAMEAQNAGADAIVINCSADTGLRACREALRIPVIGPTESTMLYAPQLVDHFTVLTFSKRTQGRFVRIAHELGVERFLEDVVSLKIPFSDIGNGDEQVVDALFHAIDKKYHEAGCDGFMLGCTDFEDVAPALSHRLLKSNIPATVFKPFEVAVSQAYITLKMGLLQGPLSYPAPNTILD